MTTATALCAQHIEAGSEHRTSARSTGEIRRCAPPTSTAVTAGLSVAATGTLFSVYLTYLELIEIAAVCTWCVGSAITWTALTVVEGPALASDRSRGNVSHGRPHR